MVRLSYQKGVWINGGTGLSRKARLPRRYNEKTVGRARGLTLCLQEFSRGWEPWAATPIEAVQRSPWTGNAHIYYRVIPSFTNVVRGTCELLCDAFSFTALSAPAAGWWRDIPVLLCLDSEEAWLQYRDAKRALQKLFSWFLPACFLCV